MGKKKPRKAISTKPATKGRKSHKGRSTPLAGKSKDATRAGLSAETKAKAIEEVLPGGVYLADVLQRLPEGLQGIDGLRKYMADLVESMNPRNPMEKMLIEQLVYCHHRAASLQGLAMRQTSLEGIRIVNELADKAMNTYRRSMLALREYRSPPRQSQVILANQVNQAESQQVALVENENSQKKT